MSSEEIPDAWPPVASVMPTQVAPIFPLPKVLLYPGIVLPLHVFEPRYRQMVEDLLDAKPWVVIAPIRTGHETEAMASPPFFPVGGLGEIVKHSRLPDGRFLITLAGLARVYLQEVESDRLYRKVRFQPMQEVLPPNNEGEQLREALRKAILERNDTFLNLPEDLPLAPLVDLLLQCLDLPVDAMCEAFAEPVVTRRANIALAEHSARE
jgi:Lon protease-like protein